MQCLVKHEANTQHVSVTMCFHSLHSLSHCITLFNKMIISTFYESTPGRFTIQYKLLFHFQNHQNIKSSLKSLRSAQDNNNTLHHVWFRWTVTWLAKFVLQSIVEGFMTVINISQQAPMSYKFATIQYRSLPLGSAIG